MAADEDLPLSKEGKDKCGEQATHRARDADECVCERNVKWRLLRLRIELLEDVS